MIDHSFYRLGREQIGLVLKHHGMIKIWINIDDKVKLRGAPVEIKA